MIHALHAQRMRRALPLDPQSTKSNGFYVQHVGYMGHYLRYFGGPGVYIHIFIYTHTHTHTLVFWVLWRSRSVTPCRLQGTNLTGLVREGEALLQDLKASCAVALTKGHP